VASEVVEASGHLIDSGLLNGIFDTVIRHNASFEVMRFTIGKSNDEPSLLRMRVTADTEDAVRTVVENLVPLGCLVASKQDATTQVAVQDGCAPDDFYSTTNHETHIRKSGKWTLVADQRMDAVIVIEGARASCRKLRDVRKGDAVVCGVEGIRVVPVFQDRDRHGFAFMTNEVSSERRVEAAVARVSEMMRSLKAEGKIRYLGLSGSVNECQRIAARHPALAEVLQLEVPTSGSPGSRVDPLVGQVTFGHLRCTGLQEIKESSADRLRRSLERGVKLNPNGTILFSTRSAHHLDEVVRILEEIERDGRA